MEIGGIVRCDGCDTIRSYGIKRPLDSRGAVS